MVVDFDPRLKDFKNFLYLTWKHLNLPEPTPIQYDIADFLQHGQKRIVIQAFRGVGKSWITSAFVCHQLLLNPQKNILVVSASKSRSDDFSTFTQRLISEMEILAHLKPNSDQRHSKISFDVGPARASHAPSVKSLGVTSQLTGSRADLIVADDVESANNSQTQLMRDRLSETVKEFDAIIKPEVGRIVFLGTPQTEFSLYNSLDERGFTTRIWTARIPTDTQRISYGNKLAGIISTSKEKVGTPTDNRRFDETDLLEREASYGRSGFSLQFMLDTTLSDMDRYPLKLNDLIVLNGCSTWSEAPTKVLWASGLENIKSLDPDIPNVGLKGDYYTAPMHVSDSFKEFEGSVLAIDPSGRGADKTAYVVVKMLHGCLYLTDFGALDGGYDEITLKRIVKAAKSQNVNEIVVESNFGDGMFVQILQPVLQKYHPCSIKEVRHNIQKEKRIIDTLEPVLNQHRLIVDDKLIRDDFNNNEQEHRLFFQLSRITKDKGALRHDDLLDCLSIAVNYWTEIMDIDQEMAGVEHKEATLMAELDNFMSHATGRSSSRLNWVN
jgi:hypothetical protein|tara:strand:+ start:32 stop:1690 length:1659 start_codon:yes stop_codon:yes gene_type:complete